VAGGQHRRAVLDRRRNFAGRWSSIRTGEGTEPGETAIELYGRTLLRRYGVVFRRLLTREPRTVAWRDLVRVYRRMEARGEIRGGRFVSGMAGEQYATADAVTVLREVRRTAPDGQLRTISTADPLNLTGIVTSGERVRAAGRNRLAYRDGIPVGVIERETVRGLVPLDASAMGDLTRALSRRRLTTKWSRHAVGGR
jgi:ATP-dependent Lhr-like helicase